MKDRDPKRTFVYRGQLPGWLALLLLGPLLLVFFSVALALVAGGLVAAGLLPLLFGRGSRRGGSPPGENTIELDPSQYRHVEAPPRHLPED